MSSGGKALAGLFGTTDFMIPMVLDDLDDEAARKRARGDDGPSIAWTIGHLMHSRVYVLNAIGLERENPWADDFGQAPASDGSGYPTLAELRAQWDALSAELTEALAGLTEERLETKLESGWHDEQVLRDQVVFFAWHEGYHMGVVGAIRKALGYPGPAERVMASRATEE